MENTIRHYQNLGFAVLGIIIGTAALTLAIYTSQMDQFVFESSVESNYNLSQLIFEGLKSELIEIDNISNQTETIMEKIEVLEKKINELDAKIENRIPGKDE